MRTLPSARPPAPDLIVFGCAADEAELFTALAPRYGVRAATTTAPATPVTAAVAGGARCVSVSHQQPVSADTLLALAAVGVEHLSTRSVGTDHIDVDAARACGIDLSTCAYSPASVADYTLMLMLMGLRHAKATVLRSHEHDYRLHPVRGRELRDLTVGVIGAGRIGTAVITRLHGFGARVLTHSRRTADSDDGVTLSELLSASDIVSLHVPLTAETHHLLDADRLAQTKPGALIVNTGRGALIDTQALLTHLRSGHLGGAALDVIEGEDAAFYADCRDRPIDPQLAQLQRLPQVLITPHTAFCTDHALADVVENTLIGCRAHSERNHHATP